MRPETAQDQQDEELTRGKLKLVSRREFKALIAKRSLSAEQQGSPTAYDPIASAMERNPGLTREKAEEMARAFGF